MYFVIPIIPITLLEIFGIVCAQFLPIQVTMTEKLYL